MDQKIRSAPRGRKTGLAAARLLATASAAALCLPAIALAQEAGSGAVESAQDIVVTANRRAESVQRVPSAVTAISGDELEARGADSFEGFARSVPGLTLNQTTKNRATFSIRGIATNTNGLANTQDPVAVYINDTPVTDTYAAAAQPDLRLFDVERIEVLRGPQGTLFGSGSLGGTVRIITKKPDATKFEAAGRVDLGVSEGGGLRQRYDAMVNVPIAEDRLGLRVVGYYRDEEGWVRNTMLGTRNDTIDWAAALRFSGHRPTRCRSRPKSFIKRAIRTKATIGAPQSAASAKRRPCRKGAGCRSPTIISRWITSSINSPT